MIIKNPEKLLKQWIPTHDGDLWYVTDVSVTIDVDNGIAYRFKLQTDAPVKSSPNQQYYHMTRTIEKEITLRITGPIYELYCDGLALHGYCKDIDSMDKFIKQVENILPRC
jgi:hypothetical protein